MTKTHHFKEIDTYMKEYWKTHIITFPHEDNSLYMIGRIKENLTMEEKPIRIIVENYDNKRFTFTMPQEANLSVQSEISFNKEGNHSRFVKQAIITGFTIEASYEGGIGMKREEIE